MSALPDSDLVDGVIRETAIAVIMPRFQTLQRSEIDEKTGPHDLVTVADIEAERMLTPRLAALVPGSVVVGEEAVAADASVLKRLQGEGPPVWIIDPIDGTANFAVGMPLFAVMVAYVDGGETRAAWIHDPVRNITFSTQSGAGVWARSAAGTERVRLREPASLAHFSGAPNMRSGTDRELGARIGARSNRIASIMMLRAASQEYMAILEGKMHFAMYQKTLPWDHAAGAMMMVEAGGVSRRFNGAPYRASDAEWLSPLLVAPGEQGWQWLYEGLFKP